MEKKTVRLEAFSDGIFSVAITLLAVEIGIKEYAGATNLNLLHKILENWVEYFVYFNSFATVFLIWMGHHRIFNKIWRANDWIIFLNGLVLLLVVLFPFPTRMVGAFINTPAVNTAIAFYAGFTCMIVVCMLLLTFGIIRNKKCIIDPEKNLVWFKNMMRGQIIAIVVYAFASITAFYLPYFAIAITFSMWIYWAIASKESDHDA